MSLSRFSCDSPGCKSTVELSAPDDIRDLDFALLRRGWVWVHEPNVPEKHYCPNHHPAPKPSTQIKHEESRDG